MRVKFYGEPLERFRYKPVLRIFLKHGNPADNCRQLKNKINSDPEWTELWQPFTLEKIYQWRNRFRSDYEKGKLKLILPFMVLSGKPKRHFAIKNDESLFVTDYRPIYVHEANLAYLRRGKRTLTRACRSLEDMIPALQDRYIRSLSEEIYEEYKHHLKNTKDAEKRIIDLQEKVAELETLLHS